MSPKTRIVVAVIQLALGGPAAAQVVADSACEKYAVDIAAFATCDSPTRVARAEDATAEASAARLIGVAEARTGMPEAGTGRQQEPAERPARRVARSKAR